MNIVAWKASYYRSNPHRYVEEVLEHYDELIKKRNTKLYNSLVKEKSKEKDRPGGVLLRIKD